MLVIQYFSPHMGYLNKPSVIVKQNQIILFIDKIKAEMS